MDKMLNKFKAEKELAYKEIQKVESQLGDRVNTVQILKAEIDELMADNEAMTKGTKKMDAIKYLQNKSDIDTKEESLAKAESDVKTFRGLMGTIKTDVFNPLMEQYVLNRVLDKEHREKNLELQKKMFKLLLDVAEVSVEMDELSKEYCGAVSNIPHPKAQYYNFSCTGGRNDILNRFCIRNLQKFEYSQHLTSKLYPFEEGIIK